jgi:hypothetical protein
MVGNTRKEDVSNSSGEKEMTLLNELLERVKKNPLDEQVKILCDQIWLEETKKPAKERLNDPSGPNIFLALSIPPNKSGWDRFLILQREMPGSFLILIRELKLERESPGTSKITRQIDRSIRNCSGNTAEKILTEYAERYKFEKGVV